MTALASWESHLAASTVASVMYALIGARRQKQFIVWE